MKKWFFWLRWLAIIIMFTLMVIPVKAKYLSVDTQKIDQFILKEMKNARIPGLALVITKDGEVIYQKGYGIDGRGAKITPQTPMMLGSLSKSFTALAILQLVEAGKIDLDALVSDYIPSFTNSDPQQSANITVRHLLNQTSGMNDQGYPDSLKTVSTLQVRVKSLQSAKPNSPAGQSFQYFNPNYSILGFIIEQVSGELYGNYMQENIFSPLGMQQTSAYPTQVRNLAQGHTLFLGFPRAIEQEMPLSEVPAGFLVTSAEDMGKFLLVQAGKMNEVISMQSLAIMQTPPEDINSSYGMGWFIGEQNGKQMIYHSGDLESFHSYAAILPDLDIQYAFLINQSGMIPALITFPRIRNGITDILTGVEPTQGINSNIFSILLMVLIFWSLIGDLKRFINIPEWAKAAIQTPYSRVILSVIPEFLIPILLISLIPLLLGLFTGHNFNWNLVYKFMPDVNLWIFVASAISLTRGFRKILAYNSATREKPGLS